MKNIIILLFAFLGLCGGKAQSSRSRKCGKKLKKASSKQQEQMIEYETNFNYIRRSV